MNILIQGGEIVNEGKRTHADIFVSAGRIEQIGGDLSGKKADKIIDATGKTIIPGMIDDQVHFREPGMEHKGHIKSESRAAVAGGITSFMEMPNTKPLAISNSALEAKFDLAQEKSLANYSFYMGASNDNLDAIKAINPKTTCGLKVFMGASTGNMLVDNPDTLDAIFREAPTLVATHCEDTPMITELEEKFRGIYGENVPMELHPKIRSEEACFKSSTLAVNLAKKHGTKLHVLHLTTELEMQHFTAGNVADKQITAEACVHHLVFDESDYRKLGSQIKCNPAIKSRRDRDALRQAVLDGKIDIIATDHAPHTWDEKQRSYFKAPSGIPLVQHAMLSLLEMSHDGIFPLELIVDKTSHAVATRYGVEERGYIREGYFADLAILDLKNGFTQEKETLHYHCGWSPFVGKSFRSTISSTIVSGHLAFHNGEFNENKTGRRLYFKG
jgi:dihydroorotase